MEINHGSHGSVHTHSNPVDRLKALLLPEKKDIGIIVIYGICSGIFALIIPIAVQTLVNTIAFGSMLQPILVLTFLVLIMLSLSAFLRGLQSVLMEIVQQRLFARLSLRLATHIPHLKMKAFEGHQGPELINRFFDVLTVQKSTSFIVIDGLAIFLQTLVGMVLLAFYHPFLLAFDIVLVALIFGLIFYLGQGAIQTSILESKKKYQVAGWLEELARIPLLFKNPSAQPFVLSHSDHLTVRYLQGRKAHFAILMRQIIGTLSLQVIASSALLGLGGWLVVKRQLTLGQLVAAELVVTSVVTGVGKFGKYLESYYDLIAAADKLGYLLDLPVEEERSVSAPLGPVQMKPELQGAIRLENVSYSHSDDLECLRGINLDLHPGEKVSIFGNRSSGKSTLADLLYRLKEPQQGLIELGGVATKDMGVSQLRTQVSFLRSIELFDGTLFDNLRIHRGKGDSVLQGGVGPSRTEGRGTNPDPTFQHPGLQSRVDRTDLTVEEVYSVFEKLGILHEIKKLSLGLMTPIVGGRSPLTFIQAKLVNLARAILAQPKLIVLDGFLEGLGDDAQQIALDVLKQQVGVTVVVLTGSKTLARQFEKRFILEDGKLRQDTGSFS